MDGSGWRGCGLFGAWEECRWGARLLLTRQLGVTRMGARDGGAGAGEGWTLAGWGVEEQIVLGPQFTSQVGETKHHRWARQRLFPHPPNKLRAFFSSTLWRAILMLSTLYCLALLCVAAASTDAKPLTDAFVSGRSCGGVRTSTSSHRCGVLWWCSSPLLTPPPAPYAASTCVPIGCGTTGTEGYHTFRIPAMILYPPTGELLAFAEVLCGPVLGCVGACTAADDARPTPYEQGRKFSAADHDWNDVVLKRLDAGPLVASRSRCSHADKQFCALSFFPTHVQRSADNGKTWSPLTIVHGESTPAKHVTIGNPAPVYDAAVRIPSNSNE